jgi:hypothetical protein
MENFFYNGEFFHNLTELLEYVEWDAAYIANLPDDSTLVVYESDYEPIQELSADFIAQRINEERFSEENCDKEFIEIVNILNNNIDFEKINSLMPKLHYSTIKKHTFTKSDMLDASEG